MLSFGLLFRVFGESFESVKSPSLDFFQVSGFTGLEETGLKSDPKTYGGESLR